MGHKAGSAAKPKQADQPAQSRVVEEQAIRDRAFQIFEERCKVGSSGDSITDWLRAEHELCDGRTLRETEGGRQETHLEEKVPTKAW